MKVHLLGIGGSGASAAASIAQGQGFDVTGCDLQPNNEFTTLFKSNQLLTDHNPSHLDNVDILAITPAVTSLNPNNPELLAARKKGTEILTWQEFMGKYLEKEKFVIAVCGTHGKSTTTAMIALILEDSGLDPTVILGAIVPKWHSNYRIGKSKYFVVEADEYNDNFLPNHPDIAIVTNIEMDHPEYFHDLKHYKESFKKFLSQTKGTIVANIADPGVAEVLKVLMKQSSVKCLDYSKNELKLKLQIPGEFNKQNANAAFQAGLLLDIDPETIKMSLQNYTGIGRRFELLGKFKGANIYTDFGHHPTEIKATMGAARQKFPGSKILLIYEPHMFTRTLSLFDDFVKVLKEIPIDKIIITDIYQSREEDKGLVNSQQLADAVNKKNTSYVSKKDLKNKLETELGKYDAVFFMGAGDIDKIAKQLLSRG